LHDCSTPERSLCDRDSLPQVCLDAGLDLVPTLADSLVKIVFCSCTVHLQKVVKEIMGIPAYLCAKPNNARDGVERSERTNWFGLLFFVDFAMLATASPKRPQAVRAHILSKQEACDLLRYFPRFFPEGTSDR